MGQVYELPVVSKTQFLPDGMAFGIRVEGGRTTRIGAPTTGVSAVFFNSDDALYNYDSAFVQGESGVICYASSALVFYFYTGGSVGTVEESTLRDNEYISSPYTNAISFMFGTGSIRISGVDAYSTSTEAAAALGLIIGDKQYPITYHYTNSTISGPSSAAVGDTVTVSAVPNAGYGITDASTQILVTNNDVAVPYTWDATNNRIMFTMPDPS